MLTSKSHSPVFESKHVLKIDIIRWYTVYIYILTCIQYLIHENIFFKYPLWFKIFSRFFTENSSELFFSWICFKKNIPSMYGTFTYIYHKYQPNVGKYTIHGSYGKEEPTMDLTRDVPDIPSSLRMQTHWPTMRRSAKLCGKRPRRCHLSSDPTPGWLDYIPSLKLTFSPLKMDGWNTTFLLGRPIFRGYVSFREGILTSYIGIIS